MQAVQIFPSTTSTTSEAFIFTEKFLYSETLTGVTVQHETQQLVGWEPKAPKVVSHKDLLAPLQEFLRGVGNVRDLLYSFNPTQFLTPLFLDQSRLTAQFTELRIEKITRNLVDSFLLGLLEGAAESEDESVFLSIAKAIDWTVRPREDLLRGVRLALRVGAFLKARELSSEGIKLYPHDSELQKYARLLAPPKVVRSDLAPTLSVKTNRNWLKEHAQSHKGRWVALRNGELQGVANSLEELVEQLGDTKGMLLTRV
jgi:hypothetical protein